MREYFQRSLSASCMDHVETYSYDKAWLESCLTMTYPSYEPWYRELAKRITVLDVTISHSAEVSTALVTFAGPNMGDFMVRLPFVSDCQSTEKMLSLLDPVSADEWPVPEKKECDEDFWQDIPHKKQSGAFILKCEGEVWRPYMERP